MCFILSGMCLSRRLTAVKTSKMGQREVYEPQYLHPALLVNLTTWFTPLKRKAGSCSAAFLQPVPSRSPHSLRLPRNGNNARSIRYVSRLLGTPFERSPTHLAV